MSSFLDKYKNDGGSEQESPKGGSGRVESVSAADLEAHVARVEEAAGRQIAVAGKVFGDDAEACVVATYAIAAVASEMETPYTGKGGSQRLSQAALLGRITPLVADHLGASRTVAGKVLAGLADQGVLFRHRLGAHAAFGLWESEERAAVDASKANTEALLKRLLDAKKGGAK